MITPDLYLHCFDQSNKSYPDVQKIYKKPDLSLKLSRFTMKQITESTIEVKIPQKSYMKILKNSEIQVFKFKTIDEAEEF